MAVLIQTNLPLEDWLREKASNSSHSFPNRAANYFERYVLIKQYLADAYYASAGAGLARSGERFTRHDIGHVDDVIQIAGELIGFGSGARSPLYMEFEPYEVFVLLLSTLLHDAGNAAGRRGHERAPKEILLELGPIIDLESPERRLIASIAEAHGGRSPSGDRDTIETIIQQSEPKIGVAKVRARRLAALLRFADELSENPRRADPQALKEPYDPPKSAVHNLYCKIINATIDYVGRSVAMEYSLEKTRLAEEFLLRDNGQLQNILLVDYIALRLEKTEQERRYCNRFLSNFASYDRIRVKLSIFDSYDLIDELGLVLEDRGYPSVSNLIRQTQPEFDGLRLRDKHMEPAPRGVPA